MNTCHGFQGKIHSSVVCSSNYPKVDEHDQDTWCLQEYLVKNWTYGGNKPVMSYGGKKPTMIEGDSTTSASLSAESRAGGMGQQPVVRR